MPYIPYFRVFSVLHGFYIIAGFITTDNSNFSFTFYFANKDLNSFPLKCRCDCIIILLYAWYSTSSTTQNEKKISYGFFTIQLRLNTVVVNFNHMFSKFDTHISVYHLWKSFKTNVFLAWHIITRRTTYKMDYKGYAFHE